MNRQEYITNIIKFLSRLPKLVESSNKLSLTDVNIISEDFYGNLLNHIYGYNLVNANKFDPNAVAIDLQDFNNKISIQVTSTSKFAKSRNTVNKFIENQLFKKFDRLVILNIVKKSAHIENKLGDSSFTFDTKNDIWDIDDLLKEIKCLSDIDHIKKIHDFLVKELRDEPITTLPNEVKTILGIIEILSNERHPESGSGFLEDPDPENKILNRFAEHSEFLTTRYYDLYLEYGKILDTINDENDLGSQALRRAGTYLKGYSDEVLNNYGGNPREALAALVETFKSHLSNNGFSFDAGAAEFYIVDQLIKCNVFPNREVISG